MPDRDLPQHHYILRWIAVVAAFNSVLVLIGEMRWPWALALTPLLGVLIGRNTYRVAQAS